MIACPNVPRKSVAGLTPCLRCRRNGPHGTPQPPQRGHSPARWRNDRHSPPTAAAERTGTIWRPSSLARSITAPAFSRSSMPTCGWFPPACERSARPWLIQVSTRPGLCSSSGTRRFSPTEMRLDGRMPDLFLVSSMHLHSAECDRLVREANRIEPSRRPLIIVGGPRFIYEPWQAFSSDPNQPSADVAVTGEEYVLLSLLEVLLSQRAGNESMRSVFQRARDRGALDGIPGLVYSRSATPEGPIEELVDTGIQQLLGESRRAAAPGARLCVARSPQPPGNSRHAGVASRPRPQALHGLVDRAHGGLQVPLLLLPDPGLQPAAASREKWRAGGGRNGPDRQQLSASALSSAPTTTSSTTPPARSTSRKRWPAR